MYWTNGGPGGSGINAGLLTEMGASFLRKRTRGYERCSKRTRLRRHRWLRAEIGRAERAHDVASNGRTVSRRRGT